MFAACHVLTASSPAPFLEDCTREGRGPAVAAAGAGEAGRAPESQDRAVGGHRRAEQAQG